MTHRLSKYHRDPNAFAVLGHRQITERDLVIIDTIYRYRFIPSSHLARLTPGNEKITRRHLHALFHLGFIRWFTFPRLGWRGEYIYYLDSAKAAELLIHYLGYDKQTVERHIKSNRDKQYYDTTIPGRLMHLHHEVMISRSRYMLEAGSRAAGEPVSTKTFLQGSSLYTKVSAPRLHYRKGNAGPNTQGVWQETAQTERLPLEPDAFFSLHFPNRPSEPEAHFFYEADRNSMNIASMIRKMRAYFHAFIKQGLHKTHYGLPHLRAVLIETTSETRFLSLLKAAASFPVSGHKPSDLFWLTYGLDSKQPQAQGTTEQSLPAYFLKPEIIFDHIWVSPKTEPGKQLHSLLDPWQQHRGASASSSNAVAQGLVQVIAAQQQPARASQQTLHFS